MTGNEKIFALDIWEKTSFIFSNIKEAAEKTGLSEKRIKHLINSGHKWKGWIFDIAQE